MGEFKSSSEQQSKNANPIQAPKEMNSEGDMQYENARKGAFQLVQFQASADDNGRKGELTQLQTKAFNYSSNSHVAQLQAKINSRIQSSQLAIFQRKENKTGLPDGLKSGMESISGMSLSDVKVHRNSDKPAQLQAHAYAQGTDIHLGPGQEKHLPHELGHVVQQKQGRVKPTTQFKSVVPINDEQFLEKEADSLGIKALSMGSIQSTMPLQAKSNSEISVTKAEINKADNRIENLNQPKSIVAQLFGKEDKKRGQQNGNSENVEIHDIPIGKEQDGNSENVEIHDIPIEEEKKGNPEKVEIHDIPIGNDVKLGLLQKGVETQIKALPFGEEIYDSSGKFLGFVKDLVHDYATEQVSKSKTIKNSKGEYAYSVSSFKKSMFKAVSSGIGAYNDGTGVAEQAKYVMEEGKVLEDSKKASGALTGIMNLSFESIPDINFITQYFDIIETLDVFGVTDILSSIGSFAHASKEKRKMQVLDVYHRNSYRMEHFPEEIADITEYALKKVSRSFYTSIAEAVLSALKGVTRIITITTGGMSAIFSESIRLASDVALKAKTAFDMVKGAFKFFRGTKGVARKENAEKLFNLVASGDQYGISFMKDYFAAGFSTFQRMAIGMLNEKMNTDKHRLVKNQLETGLKGELSNVFKMLNDNQSIPEVKFLRSMLIDQIANTMKSQPPAGKSALFQMILKEEAVQNGLSEAYEETFMK